MLVLSRKKNESVVIADGIIITIVEIRGDKVRLGIQCPREMPCHRYEVYEALQAERAAPPIGPALRSPEAQAFVQSVLETPDDVGVRLIFADWLDDHDDPYGEFIRVQCRLASGDLDSDEQAVCQRRQDELWTRHGACWRNYLPLSLRGAGFQRGFVEEVCFPVGRFIAEAQAIFAAAPVRRLSVTPSWYGSLHDQMTWLAASPYLARLSHLSLAGLGLSDHDVMPLARSEHTASLRLLDLRTNDLGNAGTEALVSSPYLDGLQDLLLKDNPRISTLSRVALMQRFGDRVHL